MKAATVMFVIFLSASAHGQHHIAERERDKLGRLLPTGRLLDGREWNEFPA